MEGGPADRRAEASGRDVPLPGPGLPDLGALDFADLEAMPESVLRRALARVLAEDTGPGRFAAFQNAL